MPNLHFYAMDRSTALKKIEKIKEILKDDPALDKMRYTIHAYIEVLDSNEVNHPYIDITGLSEIESEKLAGMLDELDIDFETSGSKKYIPARSKRKK